MSGSVASSAESRNSASRRLPSSLDLHGLAAEQAFKLPNTLLQRADLGCGDHCAFRKNGTAVR
jgi:hypothetical protein